MRKKRRNVSLRNSILSKIRNARTERTHDFAKLLALKATRRTHKKYRPRRSSISRDDDDDDDDDDCFAFTLPLSPEKEDKSSAESHSKRKGKKERSDDKNASLARD